MDLSASVIPLSHQAEVPAHSPLDDWERLMRRAASAMHLQQPRMALACQRQALALATEMALEPPVGREDDCAAAWVVSHLNLAELAQEAGDPAESGRLLCAAHSTLLRWMGDPACAPALRQAALRHARETLAALLRHAAAYGAPPDAEVTRLLQADVPWPSMRPH